MRHWTSLDGRGRRTPTALIPWLAELVTPRSNRWLSLSKPAKRMPTLVLAQPDKAGQGRGPDAPMTESAHSMGLSGFRTYAETIDGANPLVPLEVSTSSTSESPLERQRVSECRRLPAPEVAVSVPGTEAVAGGSLRVEADGRVAGVRHQGEPDVALTSLRRVARARRAWGGANQAGRGGERRPRPPSWATHARPVLQGGHPCDSLAEVRGIRQEGRIAD